MANSEERLQDKFESWRNTLKEYNLRINTPKSEVIVIARKLAKVRNLSKKVGIKELKIT